MPESARTIAGTVLDAAGRPVAQARVYFTASPTATPDIAALTAADGTFRMNAPRAGHYRIGATSDTHGSGAAEVDVDSKDATVEIRLPR